jgi:hypothetical protein
LARPMQVLLLLLQLLACICIPTQRSEPGCKLISAPAHAAAAPGAAASVGIYWHSIAIVNPWSSCPSSAAAAAVGVRACAVPL